VRVFVQVIQGAVSDPEQVHAAIDRWAEELADGAQGWLGTTAGVTDDGQFVALARFDSEEAARRNSDRPEQGEWWAETSRCFLGDATFSDSRNVIVDVNGNPEDAGFVQIMQGRGSDPERARELMAQDDEEWAAFRPDIIGSVAIEHDAGAYTMAMYFTSEEEAREGERKEPPPKLQAQMDELGSLMTAPPQFLDLRRPWFYAPR
jgi:hypothetical protein